MASAGCMAIDDDGLMAHTVIKPIRLHSRNSVTIASVVVVFVKLGVLTFFLQW